MQTNGQTHTLLPPPPHPEVTPVREHQKMCTYTPYCISKKLKKYDHLFRRDRSRVGGLDFDKDVAFDIVELFIPVILISSMTTF